MIVDKTRRIRINMTHEQTNQYTNQDIGIGTALIASSRLTESSGNILCGKSLAYVEAISGGGVCVRVSSSIEAERDQTCEHICCLDIHVSLPLLTLVDTRISQ